MLIKTFMPTITVLHDLLFLLIAELICLEPKHLKKRQITQ